MKTRLMGWKNTHLNPVGRTIMIKYVTSSMSIYQMNCFRLPKKICKDLNKIQRDFWWRKHIDTPKGVYLKGWDSFSKSITDGGLGFQNITLFNSAMIAKMGWRLNENPTSLCASLLKAKYFPNTDVMHLDPKLKQNDSWI